MANMKLNIQRFTDLDFDPNQTQNFMSALSTNIPRIAEGIDTLSNAINQLAKDWGDGHAEKEGNQFTADYRTLVTAAMQYVNSVGGFASSTGNSFANQYAVNAHYSYSATDTTVTVDDFKNVNETGKTGPVNDNIDSVFKSKYTQAISDIDNALKAVMSALQSNSNAFVTDVQSTAEGTIQSENANTRNALDNVTQSYSNYLEPYLDAAMELYNQAKAAASGAGSN